MTSSKIFNACLDKETQICISISKNPHNFGTKLHNAAYAALGLNFAYKAFFVSDIKNAIAGVRALGIRGCSVSMPFKESVMKYLDGIDESARLIGAVNTIVNDDGYLIGYNTDTMGAKKIFESIDLGLLKSILILGAGGVSRAILFSLKQLGVTSVRVANRNVKKIDNLNEIIACQPIAWSDRQLYPVDLIINATPLGMKKDDEMPVNPTFLEKSRFVMDVVVTPHETQLIRHARNMQKNVIPGYVMSLEQTMAQFTLYTKQPAPREIMQRIWHNECSKDE